MWLVLFVLARIDWGKGIGQVLASVVGYVQVETRRAVVDGGARSDDTSGTPTCDCYRNLLRRVLI